MRLGFFHCLSITTLTLCLSHCPYSSRNLFILPIRQQFIHPRINQLSCSKVDFIGLATAFGALSRFRTLILQNFLLSNQCRVHLCCRFDSGMYCVIHFLIFKRRTISAITVDSPGVVICINVFKYELICMIVITNLKSVQFHLLQHNIHRRYIEHLCLCESLLESCFRREVLPFVWHLRHGWSPEFWKVPMQRFDAKTDP